MCGRVVIIIKKHYNVVGSGNVSVFNDDFFFDWGEGGISQPSHESKSSCLIKVKNSRYFFQDLFLSKILSCFYPNLFFNQLSFFLFSKSLWEGFFALRWGPLYRWVVWFPWLAWLLFWWICRNWQAVAQTSTCEALKARWRNVCRCSVSIFWLLPIDLPIYLVLPATAPEIIIKNVSKFDHFLSRILF